MKTMLEETVIPGEEKITRKCGKKSFSLHVFLLIMEE
jgi:hypothetical protein